MREVRYCEVAHFHFYKIFMRKNFVSPKIYTNFAPQSPEGFYNSLQ